MDTTVAVLVVIHLGVVDVVFSDFDVGVTKPIFNGIWLEVSSFDFGLDQS